MEKVLNPCDLSMINLRENSKNPATAHGLKDAQTKFNKQGYHHKNKLNMASVLITK